MELSRQRTRLVTPAGTFAMPITVQEVESWCRVHECEWRAAFLWDGIRTLDEALSECLLRRKPEQQNIGGPDAGS